MSFSHTSWHLILTKLGHNDRYMNHYSRTNNDGVKRHDGVTGVKKVISTKKASSPTECVALTRDLRICITLTPSTKFITLKIQPGSLGVTGVKRSFSPKRHKSYKMRSIDVWFMHMHELDPLYKSYHIKNSSGVTWGHRGQRVIFTKKASGPTKCVALMRDSCICISVTPSTKVITLNWGHRGQKVIFTKNALTHPFCTGWPWDSCMCTSLRHSTYVIE